MSLLSYTTYVRLTGDSTTASSDAVAAMADAVDLLDDVLDRTLTYGDYVDEPVKISPSGHVTPRALPVAAVPAGVDYQVGTAATLRYVSLSGAPFFDTLDWRYLDYDNDYPARWARTTVSYSGGYTEETLPFRLKRAICLIAQAMVANPPGAVDVNVTSKTVGDVSISFKPYDQEGEVDMYVPGLWCTIRGFRRHVP